MDLDNIIYKRSKKLTPNKCSHERIKSQCKECRGSNICEHQRQKHQCKECICEHKRIRTKCKECEKYNNPDICNKFKYEYDYEDTEYVDEFNIFIKN